MNKPQWIVAATLGLVGSWIVLAGSMILTTGLLLGILSLAGFVVLYMRFAMLRRLAIRFPAFFDITAALITYMLFGNTVVGLIAAAIVGLGTSVLLDLQSKAYKLGKQEKMQAFEEALAA